MKKLLLLLFFAVSCSRVIVVENPLDVDRSAEMVACPAPTGLYRLVDAQGQEVPYQITHDGQLIFQASVPALGKVEYRLLRGAPAPVDTVAVGSLRPDRLDDIIWENDRSGWRMYGPGTHEAGQKVFGYDVFTKSVPYPVMKDRFDKDHNPASWEQIAAWREQGLDARADSLLHAISFHVDHGDGMDVYTVGASLGCGTAALLDSTGRLDFPWCWERYTILDNGPLRFRVKVVMDGGQETRIITCDAGSWFNTVELDFISFSLFGQKAPIAAGIVLHDSRPDAYVSGPGYIGYADLGDPNPGTNGEIYCGVVLPGAGEARVEQGHILLPSTWEPGFTYWFGSSWSKGGIPSLSAWSELLEREVRLRENPLKISFR